MIEAATLSSKFQVLIPKAVRQRMSSTRGQKIAFIAREDGILMATIPEREHLAGIARGANPEGQRDQGDRY